MLRALVSLALVSCVVAIPGSASTTPAVTAAGRIVFVSDWKRGGKAELYVMNTDGSRRTRVTTAVVTKTGPTFDGEPTWSPSRQWIAFSSNRKSGDAGNHDIFLVRPDGTGLHALVATKLDETSPAWSPDGRWIAYSKDTTGRGRYDLFAMRVATRQVKRLTYAVGVESVPAWSPDGCSIAYARDGQIWVMRSDGTHQHPLGRVGAGVDWAPSWSPDCRLSSSRATRRRGLAPPTMSG